MPSTPKETTTKVEPWDGAKPYLLDQYANFDQLLKDGAPKAYEGKTYNEQSQATKDALSGAESIARNGDTSNLTNASTALNSVLTQSGNTPANQTLSQLQNPVNLGTNPTDAIAKMIGNGQMANAPGTYNQNYTNSAAGLQNAQANSLANSNNPAMNYLQQTASGANIGNNPYLDKMVSKQQDTIADKLKNITNPGVDSQAAAMGRMGSGAYATQRNNAETTAANEMAKVATDMYGNQYNQDVQNQMSAAGQYGDLANQDVANRLNANQALAGTDAQQQGLRQSAAQGMNQQFNASNDYRMQGLNLASNNYQNNISNMLSANDQRMNAANSQLTATNNLNNQRLNAANMAGTVYGNQYLPSTYLSGVGEQQDAYNDKVLQADINAWDRAQQQPLQNIGNFANLLNGGGYSNTTTPVYTNTTGQVLGGLSSLAGLFALCDIREKIVRRLVGFMPLTSGEAIGIFEFTYKDDENEDVWFGPIAQEVEEKTGATVEIEGKLHIDVEQFMREVA